jgi:hypothetical protein
MKSVEIQKLVIRIGEKEITLGLDEAKELRDILNDTFGTKEIVRTPQTERIYVPYFQEPVQPYYWWYITTDCQTNTYYLSVKSSGRELSVRI